MSSILFFIIGWYLIGIIIFIIFTIFIFQEDFILSDLPTVGIVSFGGPLLLIVGILMIIEDNINEKPDKILIKKIEWKKNKKEKKT